MGSSWLLSLLWKISLQAAVLTLVILLMSRPAKNAPARLRYALWVLALVKFLVPPFAYVPSQLAFWQVEPKAATVSPMPMATSPVSEGPVTIAEPRASVGSITPGRPMGAGAPLATVDEPAPETKSFRLPDTASMLVIIWLIGVSVSLALLLARCWRQRTLLRESTMADAELTDDLSRAAACLRMRRLPKLRMSEKASTPALVGLINPVIILPASVASSCGPSDIQAMLLHELAHIKRSDLAVAWLYRLVRVVFFFHPALWFVGRELENERELACDELVVSSSAISPTDYAAGYVAALKMATGSAVPISLGMAEPFKIGKRRLEAMLRNSVPKLSIGWMLVVAMIAATGLTTFAGVRNEPKRQDKATSVSHVQPHPKTAKTREANSKNLLQTVIEGTHRAAAAIVSGKGTVTVRSWRNLSDGNPKGPVFVDETVYTVALAGDKFRLSLHNTLVRNDTRAVPGLIPTKPGYQDIREILVDGKTITNLMRSSTNTAGRVMPGSPHATVGFGGSAPLPGGSFVIDPGNTHKLPPTDDIGLTGGSWFGNGIFDLTSVRRRGPHYTNTLRLAGIQTLDGDKCYVVELIPSHTKGFVAISRIWVDPSKGYAIPRVRHYWTLGHKTFMRLEVNTELCNYGNGVWGPAKVVKTFSSLDSHKRPYKDKIETITYKPGFQLNVPIREDELALKLPPNTRVYHEKSSAYYRVQENGEWKPEATSSGATPPKGANVPADHASSLTESGNAQLSGVVLTDSGKPITGALVSAYVRDWKYTQNGTRPVGTPQTTDKLGRFRLTDLPQADRYSLEVTAGGYERGKGWHGKAASTDIQVRLRPAPGSISGRVVDNQGNPIKGRWVKLGTGKGSLWSCWTDDKGRFRLVDLVPGQEYGPLGVELGGKLAIYHGRVAVGAKNIVFAVDPDPDASKRLNAQPSPFGRAGRPIPQPTSGGAPITGSGTSGAQKALELPCAGKIGALFGSRYHPILKQTRLHTGIDIAAPSGTPIVAMSDGVVTKSEWDRAYGKTIEIDHGKGVSTLYAHCSKLAVWKNMHVRRGQVIAYVGSTGWVSGGPQCHFEKRVQGKPVNPI